MNLKNPPSIEEFRDARGNTTDSTVGDAATSLGQYSKGSWPWLRRYMVAVAQEINAGRSITDYEQYLFGHPLRAAASTDLNPRAVRLALRLFPETYASEDIEALFKTGASYLNTINGAKVDKSLRYVLNRKRAAGPRL